MKKKNVAELSDLINDHIAYLQILGAKWSGDILEQLKDAQKELLEYFLYTQKNFGAVGFDAGTNKKFEQIKSKIETLLNQAYAQSMEGVRKDTLSLSENEAKWSASLLKAMSGQSVAQVGKRTVSNIAKYGRYNGMNLAEMFNSMAISDADRIFKSVSQAIKSGSTPHELKKSVQKAFNIADDQAYAVGLTCANGIANDAKLALYSENQDVVKEIEILNTLDGRVCPRCADLGGKRFPVNAKNIPALPVHPRCRCVYIPVTELSDSGNVRRPAANSDFMSDAKRAYEEKNTGRSWESLSEATKHKYYYEAISEYENRTGKKAFEQVPGSMRFQDYFESRSEQFKKDWLKKTRYILYKKGKLSLNEMIMPDAGGFFTIAELKKRDIEAFRKAGVL